MRILALSRLVVFVILGMLGAKTARAQAGCPVAADTVQVNLSGTITYATSPAVQFSTTLTQSRNQSLACGTPVQTLIGEPICDPSLLPLPTLLAKKVFAVLDRRVGLFDLSCGNLQGSFSFGQAPFALVTASFTLRMRSPTSIDATLTAFVPAGESALGMFDGKLVSSEVITRGTPGFAHGAGSLQVFTTVGASNVPLTASYQFLGAPAAVLPSSIRLSHDMDYDCTTGILSSNLCLGSAVPATSAPALALFSFGLLLLGALAGRRRARAA